MPSARPWGIPFCLLPPLLQQRCSHPAPLLKTGGNQVQRHPEVLAELLQVRGVGLIVNVLHAYMNSLYLEGGMLDASATSQQLSEQQRVLATRQAHQHMVAVAQQLVSDKRLDKALIDAFVQPLALPFHRVVLVYMFHSAYQITKFVPIPIEGA